MGRRWVAALTLSVVLGVSACAGGDGCSAGVDEQPQEIDARAS
jgi:hypothetical protein